MDKKRWDTLNKNHAKFAWNGFKQNKEKQAPQATQQHIPVAKRH